MLIYNRTAADVTEARRIIIKKQSSEGLNTAEQEAYDSGLRGAYSFTDWNRVESKVREIADWLNCLGYEVAVNTKIDWNANDLLGIEDIERYLANISILREAYIQLSTSPTAPDISRWIDYKAANDIERILFDTEAAIMSSVMYTPRSGTISAGQTRHRYKYAFDPNAIYAIDLGKALEIISDVVSAYEDGDALYITAPEGTIRME